jgi:hypothetical protein
MGHVGIDPYKLLSAKRDAFSQNIDVNAALVDIHDLTNIMAVVGPGVGGGEHIRAVIIGAHNGHKVSLPIERPKK